VATRLRWPHVTAAVAVPVLGLLAAYGNALDWSAPREIRREALAVHSRAADARRVVLVSVDGLAARLLDAGDFPTFARLRREGLVAERAETVDPPWTLPSHTSMLTGVPPERHGVVWNNWQPWRRLRAETLFDACERRALRCGLFSAKAKFAHFAELEPGVERWERGSLADDVFARALVYVRERDPDFVMVHVAEVDWMGHQEGWDSPGQLRAVGWIDLQLGHFLEGLRASGSGRLALLLTADHGGRGTEHDGDAPEVRRIPWILWGDDIPAGSIPEASTLDTAPTVLSLLGVDPPGDWPGHARLPTATATAPHAP
jgi:hypothetical protein